MRLEKEIHQTAFKNEYQKGLVNIIYTYNWTTERLKNIFKKEGISMQQFNILRILRGSPAPVSILQIKERMLDKMSDTSRIVDRLVLKQLANKVPGKTDKRLVDITISEKGKKLLAKMDKHQAAIENIIQNLSPGEAKTLNTLLDKIRQPS